MGLPAKRALEQLWTYRRPDVVHIVTEGPLGWSALQAALKLRIPAVSDFRTNFHAYSRHYGIGWLSKPILAYLRKFHNRTLCTMVPTEAMRADLAARGFCRLRVVARGVDTALFDPARRSEALRASWGARAADPVLLHVGRLAPEKNLSALLAAFDAVRKHGAARAPRADRRRAFAPRSAGALPGGDPRRRAARRRPGRALRLGGCVPVPEPDRDLRQRDRGGAGERPGSDRLSTTPLPRRISATATTGCWRISTIPRNSPRSPPDWSRTCRRSARWAATRGRTCSRTTGGTWCTSSRACSSPPPAPAAGASTEVRAAAARARPCPRVRSPRRHRQGTAGTARPAAAAKSPPGRRPERASSRTAPPF